MIYERNCHAAHTIQDMESLEGKTAIVTGGTRGIGRAIAERLLREGASVAICGRTADSTSQAVAALKPLGNVIGHPADIAVLDQVRQFFKAVDREFPRLDILVNNAGRGVFRKIGEMTPEEWHRNIDLNLNGAFYCSHEASGCC
jgi:3-oxoacyl-[acyl-carrier protein] reductase